MTNTVSPQALREHRWSDLESHVPSGPRLKRCSYIAFLVLNFLRRSDLLVCLSEIRGLTRQLPLVIGRASAPSIQIRMPPLSFAFAWAARKPALNPAIRAPERRQHKVKWSQDRVESDGVHQDVLSHASCYMHAQLK
eukprot:530098-Rhodomonas_salina.1